MANFWFGGFVVESETMTVEGSETLPMNPESETWKSLLRCATLCSRAEFVRFEILNGRAPLLSQVPTA